MAKKFNLAALVPEMEAVSNSDTPRITMIPITELRPNGGNFYDTSNFEDLADSIELNGLLEPLCVFRRGQGTGSYVIFSGHRRYLALHLLYKKDRARWNEVPCIVFPDPHDANRETVMLIHANSTGRVLSNWEKAEQAIIRATEEKGLKTTIEYGEAAFYGPKLDFMVRDAIGRKWQLGTIQVDYNLPERFDLTYKGADDKLHRPIMIHRAPFGSMERFVAVLLEHTGGKFPLWLSPDQVVVLPISEKFNDYARKVADYLNRYDVRAQVDDRNEKIGRKIRDNELKRIPYLVIVGEKEEAEGKVSIRVQGEGDKGQMTLEEYKDYMVGLVKAEMEANKIEK